MGKQNIKLKKPPLIREIDYKRIFKDGKFEIAMAVGYEFNSEYWAVVRFIENYVSNEGKRFSKVNHNFDKRYDTYIIKKVYNNPSELGKKVIIDVIVYLVYAGKELPKESFANFLTDKEMVIYSGHARSGHGPDFDEDKSTKENFVIGDNSKLHRNGKLPQTKPYHGAPIPVTQSNDLEMLSRQRRFHGDSYQVWAFNACSSRMYLDEIRGGLVLDENGKIKSKDNLLLLGTKVSIYSDALPILKAVLEGKGTKEILKEMNEKENENRKRPTTAHPKGEKPLKNIYFSD